MTHTIAWQLSLCPELPHISGSSEYSAYCSQLAAIDTQLKHYQLEQKIIARCLQRLEEQSHKTLSPRRRARLIENHAIALRCTLARRLLGRSFRQFHLDLAQSWVLQSFVGIFALDRVVVPTKSQLERYEKWFTSDELEAIMREHVRSVLADDRHDLTVDRVYADSTCIQANIHHPIDWVLVRDAGRSLLRTIMTIRRHGFRHRMPDPARLLKELNTVSMQMTQARRKKDAKRIRKQVLRRMKKLLQRIAEHGHRYCALLRKHQGTGLLTQNRVNHFIDRLQMLLDRVPHALWQTHERIIGERKVANADKMLSLYEDHIHVLVRGKAGKEVEFGNALYLAEQEQGLLVDWNLSQDQPAPDSTLVQASVKRMDHHYQSHPISGYAADRGFSSQTNTRFFERHGIYDATCPRNPRDQERRLAEHTFRVMQRRRAQTEARIGILRNIFLDGLIRSKGFENRKRTVLWSIWTHNLWLVARWTTQRRQQQLAA